MYDSTRAYFQSPGEHSFRGAFQFPFVTGAIAIVLSMIFSYLLFTVIDPGLNEMLVEKSLDQMEMIKNFAGEEAYEEAMENLDESTLGMSVKTMLYGVMIALIIPVGVFALIFAAILRNIERKRREAA